MNKKIIFTAGGTGGHLLPAINLMKHFSEKGNNVILVTDKRGNKYIKNFLDYKSYVFKAGTPTNKNIFKKFLSFFVILGSLIKSVLILFKEKPDLVIGFGGYVSFPISFVSKLFNSPLIIYENNLVFGRANKFLLKFAKKILTAKPIKKDFNCSFLLEGLGTMTVLVMSIGFTMFLPIVYFLGLYHTRLITSIT